MLLFRLVVFLNFGCWVDKFHWQYFSPFKVFSFVLFGCKSSPNFLLLFLYCVTSDCLFFAFRHIAQKLWSDENKQIQCSQGAITTVSTKLSLVISSLNIVFGGWKLSLSANFLCGFIYILKSVRCIMKIIKFWISVRGVEIVCYIQFSLTVIEILCVYYKWHFKLPVCCTH